MFTLDIIYFISWTYLSAVIISEILIFDIPAYFSKKDNNHKRLNRAFEYYISRHNMLFYKVIPLFCLSIVVTIIANIILNYNDFILSAIAILFLAGLLVTVQTKKNVTIVTEMKKDTQINLRAKEKNIKSIFIAHVLTLMILIVMLLLYIFKF